jgi:hypothetical protein
MYYRSDHKTQVIVLLGRGEILARQHYYRVIEANLGKFTSLVEIGTLMLREP